MHLEVLDHPFSGDEFINFIEGVLDQMQPWPLPNSVLAMDNASIHKVHGIREMVEERCVTFTVIAFPLLIIFSVACGCFTYHPIPPTLTPSKKHSPPLSHG